MQYRSVGASRAAGLVLEEELRDEVAARISERAQDPAAFFCTPNQLARQRRTESGADAREGSGADQTDVAPVEVVVVTVVDRTVAEEADDSLCTSGVRGPGRLTDDVDWWRQCRFQHTSRRTRRHEHSVRARVLGNLALGATLELAGLALRRASFDGSAASNGSQTRRPPQAHLNVSGERSG